MAEELILTKAIEDFNTHLKEKEYTDNDISAIMEALQWGKSLHEDQKRASGEPYYIHPVAVADTLIDLNMDKETIMAALLHDTVEDTGTTHEEIATRFGEETAQLVDGVTKITLLKAKTKSHQEIETIRKMLIAMVKDIRVILIKLSDKVHNMNTLDFLRLERQQAISRECLDIYAPLAGKLGIGWIKAELEDLSFKYINPDAYHQIKDYLDTKTEVRIQSLEVVKEKVLQSTNEDDINVQISARVKNIYSIHKKMVRTGKRIEEIYDILGIRILCETANECYILLGIVHKLWIPVERRFKDYIVVPKTNKYQSLHTTVILDNNEMLEVQIRSHSMNHTAEYGIAAHWLYKARKSAKSMKEKDISLVNKLKNWNSLENQKRNFLNGLKQEILEDTIYIFSPAGDVFELPLGATAIDFAYYIHTEVGKHCSGAKADGYIIPLSKQLVNTQVVEIITSKNAKPNPEWLNIVKTSKARASIRLWLRQHEEAIAAEAANAPGVKKNFTTTDIPKEENPKHEEVIHNDDEIVTEVHDSNRISFKVDGEKNMMISFANCCKPNTGDPIIGYISVGRGIIVHKSDCPNLLYINDFNKRTIKVDWEANSTGKTRRFKVTAKITKDLFSEIEGAIKKHHGHLIEGKITEEDGRLSGFFTLEISQEENFGKMLKLIRTIPSITNIYAV